MKTNELKIIKSDSSKQPEYFDNSIYTFHPLRKHVLLIYYEGIKHMSLEGRSVN